VQYELAPSRRRSAGLIDGLPPPAEAAGAEYRSWPYVQLRGRRLAALPLDLFGWRSRV